MRRIVWAATVAMTVSLAAVASAAAGDANGLHNRFAHADVRESPAAQQTLAQRAAALSANPSAAAGALKDSLDAEGIVSLDPLTKTVRFAGSTSSFLTGTSSAPASSIASSYVAAHAAAFGLDSSGLAALHLRTDYVSVDGTHHLSYVQQMNGLNVFGNGVKVNVAKDGRIINVVGSPIASASGAPAVSPGITAAQAVSTSRAGVQETVAPLAAKTAGDTAQTTSFANGDQAHLVYFANLNGLTLGWQTLIWGRSDAWQTVIDAGTGKLLYRQTISSDANGSVWTNYPGAAVGGTQQTVNLSPWLNSGATTLTGPNVHVYSDVNDDNAAGSGEEVAPSDTAGNFNYSFQAFGSAPFGNTTNSDCSALFPCSWDSSFPSGAATFPGQTARGSWRVNRAQNAVQVFFFTNNFHDHLAASPIGFTDAAGNFDGTRRAERGARRRCGHDLRRSSRIRPHGQREHVDASGRHVAPDADVPVQRPRRRRPVFGGTRAPIRSSQGNGGDEADVVYHEYTHGLSNRLVVDAHGNSTLGSIQAGVDGRGVERLVRDGLPRQPGPVHGHRRRRRAPRRRVRRRRAGPDPHPADGLPGRLARSGLPRRCPARRRLHLRRLRQDHRPGPRCTPTARSGARPSGTCARRSASDDRGLVTRAMELSPANPSYPRHAQLDPAGRPGRQRRQRTTTRSGRVFAHRGMGYFAGCDRRRRHRAGRGLLAAADARRRRQADGHGHRRATRAPHRRRVGRVRRPRLRLRRRLRRTGRRQGTLRPQEHLRPAPTLMCGSRARATTGPCKTVTINGNANQLDWQLKRDWASLGGGASVVSFTGPDFAPACPPAGAIDQTDGIGWGSTTDGDDGEQ